MIAGIEQFPDARKIHEWMDAQGDQNAGTAFGMLLDPRATAALIREIGFADPLLLPADAGSQHGDPVTLGKLAGDLRAENSAATTKGRILIIAKQNIQNRRWAADYAVFRSRLRSDSTISSTSSAKLISGCQPRTFFALLGSANKRSTSAGL